MLQVFPENVCIVCISCWLRSHLIFIDCPPMVHSSCRKESWISCSWTFRACEESQIVDDHESTREDWPALRLWRGRCIEVSFNLRYMCVKYVKDG